MAEKSALGGQAGPFLDNADVIIVIDRNILLIPRMTWPAPGAKVMHIAADDLEIQHRY